VLSLLELQPHGGLVWQRDRAALLMRMAAVHAQMSGIGQEAGMLANKFTAVMASQLGSCQRRRQKGDHQQLPLTATCSAS
jgi:hypothetical protein